MLTEQIGSAVALRLPSLSDVLDPLRQRLIIVSGKGGVGKTTVAATLAYMSASGGARTLLARADPHDRAWHLFADGATSFSGDEAPQIVDNLDIVDIRPEAALREYGAMVLHSKRLYAAVFENRLVAPFLRGTPGISAWATLGKVCFHINPSMVGSAKVDPSLQYDRVIFDAPATGHLLDMVRVPLVIHRTASSGLLRRGADGALDVLADPETTRWLITSTAEPFSLRETVELAESLVREFPSQRPAALLNQSLPERLTGPLLKVAHLLPVRRLDYTHLLRRVVRREQDQRAALQRLAETFENVLQMPLLLEPPRASLLADSLKYGEHSDRERRPA